MKFPFPALPTLPTRKRGPFYRGAQIALENVLEDYIAAAQEEEEEEEGEMDGGDTAMLLNVIEELEENRPTVSGWERKTVLKGGSWVYGVLRGVVEGQGQGDGKGKAKRGEGSVHVEEVVGALMAWVDGEFAR